MLVVEEILNRNWIARYVEKRKGDNKGAYLPMSPPTGHHTLSMVRRFPEAKGRNSRNSAPSTGRFPPTPMAMTEYMAQTLGVCVRNCFIQRSITGGNIKYYPVQVRLPPTAVPKTPAKKSVMLNAKRRPIKSDAIPQKLAPIHSPTNNAHVVNRTCDSETPNSRDSWGRVRATPCT